MIRRTRSLLNFLATMVRIYTRLHMNMALLQSSNWLVLCRWLDDGSHE